ncbi:MAG: VanZ family protein [Clostridia bacterium]
MNKKQLALRISGGILLGITALVMIYYAYNLLIGAMNSIRPVLFCMVSVCVPMGAGAALIVLSVSNEAERRKFVCAVMWVLFGYYLLALFVTLVYSRIHFVTYIADHAFYRANWSLMTNFVPLETIRLYIRCLLYDFIGTTIPISNLMGNVLMFMPMAVFLPCLFPSMRTFWRFLLLMMAILVAVEALQLVLCCGSCDIDDVILNLSGTLLVYGLMHIQLIKRFLQKIYLLPLDAQSAA